MLRPPKVVIDPSSRVLYSSFYIEGLYNEFGKKNISFSNRYFNDLKRRQDSHAYDHYMAFVVIHEKGAIKKYIIDFRDKTSVKENAYLWCDKYAKINFNKELTDKKFHDKIISIPPGFGIRIWSLYRTIVNCLINYYKCRFNPLVSLRNHLADYYAQYKRPPLKDYNIGTNQSNYTKPYVFMIATLWKNDNCITGTNLLRKIFIETVSNTDCNFEGGFYAASDHPQYEEFRNIIFTNRYSAKEYIEKTKKSAIVFNTPAVHNCHGWKLGEYLAMGKAIISTPLSNELPRKMGHGENIHFVQNISELKNAIERVLTDTAYRKSLEKKAIEYYSNYAAPTMVIRSIVN